MSPSKRTATRRLRMRSAWAWCISGVSLALALGLAAPVAAPGASWTAAQDLSASGQPASDARVAMSPTGLATSVWTEGAGGSTRTRAGRYDAQTGTASAAEYVSDPGAEERLPQVAADGAGATMLVTEFSDAVTPFGLHARRRTAGGTWTDLGSLGEGTGALLGADLAGNAMLIFSAGGDLQARRYAAGAWGAPVTLAAGGTGVDLAPGAQALAVGPGGTAVAVWMASSAGIDSLAARVYQPGSGWGAALTLDSGSAFGEGPDVFDPAVAVDAQGNAVVVWSAHGAGSASMVRTVRYDALVDAWGAPSELTDEAQPTGQAAVAAGAGGVAFATWRRFDGANWVIQASRLAGGLWGAATDLSPPGTDAAGPSIDVDGRGDAVAVWARSSIEARRFTGGSWSATDILSGPGAAGPHVATDADGNATAVWTGADAIRRAILVAAPTVVSPPSTSGTATQGLTLTGTTGSWRGTPPVTLGLRWRRCDAAGQACGDIPGATGSSHQLAAADAGSTVRLRVAATNAGGTTVADSAPSAVVAADTTPPVTTIDAGPSGSVSSASASFAFSASEAGSSFECRLDGASFGACSSPAAYSGLSEGLHTFSVRAIDLAGNTDGTPATRSWTVDTVAPETSFDGGAAGELCRATSASSFSLMRRGGVVVRVPP